MSNNMNQAAIKLTIDDNGVATVLMDNAAKGNAFDDTIISQLTQAFNEVEQQKRICCSGFFVFILLYKSY